MEEENLMHARSAASDQPPAYDPRRWLALSVVLLAAVMDLIDVTIVNVAIPSIREDLGAAAADIEWIVAGYTLAFAVGLITGGRLGDVYGRKRLFLLGVAGFTVASIVCGLAQSADALIAARVVQGGFAALMVPQVLSMIQVLFPPEERPKAYGMFGAFAGMATVGGPLIGGLLVQANLFELGWRPIFLINLPVGLATLAAAWVLLRESRAEERPRLDLVGVGLVTVALLLVLYPLIEGRELGWPTWAIVSLATSAPVAGLFVLHQRRRERLGRTPLVPLGLFRTRAFGGGVLAGLAFFSGVSSAFLVLTIALQAGLGFSPLHTALTFLPWSLGIAAAAGASVQLAPRLGRRLTAAGALAMALGMGAMMFAAASAGAELTSWALAPGLLLGGLGMGMVAPTLVDVVLAGVPGRDAGAASGVLNTAFQLGGAIGVAVIGVVFFGLLPEGGELAADPAGGFVAALRDSLVFEIAIYAASALLMLLLPRHAAQPSGDTAAEPMGA
jgi:EmrB/QacA subfamily drug resistance transporter